MEVNVLSTLNAVPDQVSFKVYQNTSLFDSGVSNTVGGSFTNTGLTLSIDLPLTLTDVGDYQIYLEAPGFSHSLTYTVDQQTAIEDYHTITGKITLPLTGSYTVYRGSDVITRGTSTGSFDLVLRTHPSLDPLLLVMEDADGDYTDHNLFYITPQTLASIKELRLYLDRVNREVALDGLEFTQSDYISWLMAGRDRFNGHTLGTDFDMMGATGPIRAQWLICAQVTALRTRYLEEGLASFSYGGASVTLDQDLTQYLESQASTLEQRIEQELPTLKKELNVRGITHGSGKWDIRNHHIGVLGTSGSPVSGNYRLDPYTIQRR